jgi:hypothetical protein
MKKVVPARSAKKISPITKSVNRMKSAPAKGRGKPPVELRKPIKKALPSKPVAKPAVKPVLKTAAAKPIASLVPPPTVGFTSKAMLPAKAPSRPVVVIPPRIIPPKPVTNGHGSTLTGLKPITPPNASKQATPAKIETTIPADKDLSLKGDKAGQHVKDRLVLMVPDPFWLHAFWELSHQAVQRAEAALGQDWHGAKPIIRLFDVTSQDTTSTSELPIRDISVHGGCSHWYIDIPQPPRSYRADIGYLSRRGQFFVLARSNVVLPPKAGASEVIEEPWKEELEETGPEKILAMSSGYEKTAGPSQLNDLIEERFNRPLKDTPLGTGATLPTKLKKFGFELDAELIVYGKTEPSASVTLQNEPVKLRPDGTFTMRFSLPDSRQIIPAVATAADGMEERTIVLAVERNTKHLDPMLHDLLGE